MAAAYVGRRQARQWKKKRRKNGQRVKRTKAAMMMMMMMVVTNSESTSASDGDGLVRSQEGPQQARVEAAAAVLAVSAGPKEKLLPVVARLTRPGRLPTHRVRQRQHQHQRGSRSRSRSTPKSVTAGIQERTGPPTAILIRPRRQAHQAHHPLMDLTRSSPLKATLSKMKRRLLVKKPRPGGLRRKRQP